MPSNFEVLSLWVTVAVGVVPVGITILLWRSDHRAARRRLVAERQRAAARALVDAGAKVSVDLLHSKQVDEWFKSSLTLQVYDVSAAYGVGAWPLLSKVDQWRELTANELLYRLGDGASRSDEAADVLSKASYELQRLFESWDTKAPFRELNFRQAILAQQHHEHGGEDAFNPAEYAVKVDEYLLLHTPASAQWLQGTNSARWPLLRRRVSRRLRSLYGRAASEPVAGE